MRLKILLLLCAILMGGGLFWLTQSSTPSSLTASSTPIGGSFELIGTDHQIVKDSDFRGKLMLVFFGYSFCPDFCPNELHKMVRLLEALGPKSSNIQPIFITIDPKRDTPELLKEYVLFYSPRIIGLTGDENQINKVINDYRVYAAKVDSDDPDYYLMDHSTYMYLMDEDGHFLTVFPYGTPVDEMANVILKRLKEDKKWQVN